MRFPAWIRRPANWVEGEQRGLVIALGAIAACVIISPLLLSPGGWGLRGGSSVEEKTIKQLSESEAEEITTTTITTTSGKTVWDWLSLLGVPLSLFFLGAWFQAKQQQQVAAEAEEEILQIYFDRISVLLVDKNLLGIATKENNSSEQKELLSASADVIRARTLSILRRFRNSREKKTSVIRFLIETEVIARLRLNLSEADLSGANLFFADLRDANLRDANLRGADLRAANLRTANLNGADLIGAKLRAANLNGAKLRGVQLRGDDLIGAQLRGAYLSGADLCKADLIGADLCEADLSGADLSLADVTDAKFGAGIGLSDAAKQDLIQRGAIFDDGP